MHVLHSLTLLGLIQVPLVQGRADFQLNAVSLTRALQKWYNEETGLYDTTGWWNSANCISAIADLTALDPQVSIITGALWDKTFEKAQRFNLRMAVQPQSYSSVGQQIPMKKQRSRSGVEIEEFRPAVGEVPAFVRQAAIAAGPSMITRVRDADPKGFLNDFFDDEAWWGLAWLKVFDLTHEPAYLKAAQYLFDDIQIEGGRNTTCGGVWWDRKRSANTAISNALFLSLGAHLATRVTDASERQRYSVAAVKQWQWFDRSGMINNQSQINDGLDLATCKNNNAEVWSYNQGVILGALVELNKLYPENPTFYVSHAVAIADAAISLMVDEDGIFRDPREPNLGGDGYQFKGIFARNLKELYKVQPKPSYKKFLETNADALWSRARNEATGLVSGSWGGPFDEKHSNAASQSSGLDLLVAAAWVQ